MEDRKIVKALRQRIEILEKLLLEEVLKNDLMNEKLGLTNIKVELRLEN
ncbi:hypothetical protein [Pedobacter caeni]|uniref:Uncharacterized protein n=1 Tax=Pedobacter caeni TaxID=288992 RepID=A0A1M5GXQ9_9SPHI|nr:hypothetical protein [Pedobacter caeni]SHG08501.1 hypothetical protein SAMN04488522_104414 [Pedobacter caeni]